MVIQLSSLQDQLLFLNNYKSKYSMSQGQIAKQSLCGAGQVVGCQLCCSNKQVLAKYQKLVELLTKKIRQLQKKQKSTIKTQQAGHQSRVGAGEGFETKSGIFNRQISFDRVQDGMADLQKPGVGSMVVPLQAARGRPGEEWHLGESQHLKRMQKISLVINGLTQEVMQLKSNLMHIRHCVYAFLKAIDISDKIQGQTIALNITLALISIFQFSENEKEEMFNNKKVKHKKKVLNENKENIFVTIKEI